MQQYIVFMWGVCVEPARAHFMYSSLALHEQSKAQQMHAAPNRAESSFMEDTPCTSCCKLLAGRLQTQSADLAQTVTDVLERVCC